mmetsp:Transcript_22528/g.49088  ORF Transcript_22528/g.49088 Transcript_22528/m.49088 type:complete len:221 (-) Transcript_22528:1584-2246(-)
MVLRGQGKVQHKGISTENNLILEFKGCLLLGVQGKLVALVVGQFFFLLGFTGNSGGIQISDVISLQHFCGLHGVDSNKVISSIRTSIDGDRINTTGVQLEVVSAVIDTILHNDPTVIFRVVLFHFGESEGLLATSFLDGSRRRSCRFFLLLLQASKSSRGGFIVESMHPSTGLLTGLRGMLKSKDVFSGSRLIHVHLDAEHLIVAHSHEVPSLAIRLQVV